MVSAAPVWFTMLVQFVVAMVATISFGITFQVGRRHYWTCGFVGAVGWTIYIACTTLGGMTAPMATLIATLPLAALSRFFAIRHKAPITVFLLTGIFPLVPGAGIYYTAYYFLRNDRALCTSKGIETLKVAVALALGIGVLYGKEKLLDAMPPFLTGGEMIDSVTRDGAVYAELPHKFEAGTVNAGGAVALAAAIDYLESVGLENVHAQEQALTRYAYEGMKKIPGVNILGSDDPDKHCGILSFTVDGVHPHDIATILDSCHVDVRAGHHCAQPLLAYLGVRSCARASLAFYNTTADIDRFLAALGGVRKEMGYAE